MTNFENAPDTAVVAKTTGQMSMSIANLGRNPLRGVRPVHAQPTVATRGVCPLWVISGHHRGAQGCPLYPRERTSSAVPVNVRYVPQPDISRSTIRPVSGRPSPPGAQATLLRRGIQAS